MSLSNKIDYAVIFMVDHANPNGDPLNGNRPRSDYNGYGEVSDVCLKRKMRDRLQEEGQSIFVQSDDRKIDGMPSLKERILSDTYGLGKDIFKKLSSEEIAKKACEKWYDIRAFGQLLAFRDKDAKGVSIAIRGPITVQAAYSIDPVTITSIQITKSVSGEGDGSKRGSDTMGTKHRVDKGVYLFFGSINPQLAQRTGYDDADAAIFKRILPRLFENDASSARPEGSMYVKSVFWWQHNCLSGQYSSARVHRSLKVNPDGSYAVDESQTPGLKPEIIGGF